MNKKELLNVEEFNTDEYDFIDIDEKEEKNREKIIKELRKNNKTDKYTKEFKKLMYENTLFTHINIPKSILFLDELTDSEQKLLTILKAFCSGKDPENDKKDNYDNCYYGHNDYLCIYMGLTKGRISQMLSHLQELKLIKIQMKKKTNNYGKVTTEREIRLTNISKMIFNNEIPFYLFSLIDLTSSLIYLTGSLIDYEYNIINNIITYYISKDISIFPEEKILDKNKINNSPKKSINNYENINNKELINNKLPNSKNINIPSNNKINNSLNSNINKLEKNNSPKKSINNNLPNNKINIVNDFPREFRKLIEIWNTNKLTSNHVSDKDGNLLLDKKVPKTLLKAYSYYKYLKAGTYTKMCTNITTDFLDKNNIPISVKKKKWTGKEIRETITKCLLQYQDGYWPFTLQEKKRLLPNTLESLFYAAYNNKCPSVFLKVAYNPPVLNEKKAPKKQIIKYPETFKKYYNEFFSHLDEDDTQYNILIRTVNNFIEKYDAIYERKIVYKNKYYKRCDFDNSTAFKVHFGDLYKFIDEHHAYIYKIMQSKNDIDALTIMQVDNGFWKSFIKQYENKHEINLIASDEYLLDVLKEYLNKKRA